MFDSDEPVRVAAGIMRRNDEVLICQRGINHRYGLKWEFPGGKIYPGEDLRECLVRELEEELDIIPTTFRELKTIHADYPDGGRFLITFFLIQEFEGELTNRVFENMMWVPVASLAEVDLLEGSRPIIAHL